VRPDLNTIYARHRDFVRLAVLVSAYLVMALLFLRPGGYILEWWGYYMPHTGFVRLSDRGYYPYLHYWMEYPPLLSWLAIAAYRLSHLFPVWNHPWLWYNLSMGAFLLPFEVGNLVLVYLVALKAYDRPTAVRCAVFYASLFVPLFTLLSWYDSFPLFFLLLGLYLIILGRPILAGLATGAGFMAKLIPILLLPAGWQGVQPPRRKSVLYVAAAAATILVIALPFLILRADLFVASFTNMISRTSWETVWALLEGNYTGGSVTPLNQRFDPSTASQLDQPSSLPWLVITVAFALLYLFIYTRRISWQQPKRILAFTGLTINLFMLYSKGYSPQFLVYILPFVVLLLPNLKGIAYALLLSGINFLEWPVAQIVLPDQQWLFAIAVLLRTLLWAALAFEYAFVLFPSMRPRRLSRWVAAVPLGLAFVGLVIAGLLALRAYSADRYAEDPYREVIDFLNEQDEPGIVVADSSLYRRFYPFLARGVGLRLLGSDEWALERLEKLAAERDVIWIVDIGTEDEQKVYSTLERWLSEHYFPLNSQWFGNSRLSAYATGSAPPLHPAETNFGHKARLTGYGVDEGPVSAGEILRLSLRWQAVDEMDKDYVVFVHLVGPDGRIWSQRDSQPAGGFSPTSSWTVGSEVQDHHALRLGADLPPGEYRLVLGLYDPDTEERLLVVDEQGQTLGDSLDLQTIQVTAPVN
jgi:uncharacterized membrane protein